MNHQEFIDQYLHDIDWYIKGDILHVDDDLNFQGDKRITQLPNNLLIDGDLYLLGTRIMYLPEVLTITGELDLFGTNIRTLPNKLRIGYKLYLLNSKITSLPKGLYVGDRIYSEDKLNMLEQTQLNIIAQNKTHIEIIKDPTESAKKLHKLLWNL